MLLVLVLPIGFLCIKSSSLVVAPFFSGEPLLGGLKRFFWDHTKSDPCLKATFSWGKLHLPPPPTKCAKEDFFKEIAMLSVWRVVLSFHTFLGGS